MALPISAGSRSLTLGDVAEIRRTYAEPRTFQMRFNGKGVIGLGVVMAREGNMLTLGKALDAEIGRIQNELPVVRFVRSAS